MGGVGPRVEEDFAGAGCAGLGAAPVGVSAGVSAGLTVVATGPDGLTGIGLGVISVFGSRPETTPDTGFVSVEVVDVSTFFEIVEDR
jgi:hypothetical protein